MTTSETLPDLEKKPIRLFWIFTLLTAVVLILGISQASALSGSIKSASGAVSYSTAQEKLTKAEQALSAAESEQAAFIANNPAGKNTSWVDHQVEMAQLAKQYAEKALAGMAPETGLSVPTMKMYQTFWVVFTIIGTLALGGLSLRYYLIGTADRRAFTAEQQKAENVRIEAENARLEAESAARRREEEAKLIAEEKKNPVNRSLISLNTWGLIFLLAGIVFQLWGAAIVSSELGSSLLSLDAKAVSNGTALQVGGNWFVGVGVAMLIAKQVASAINWQIRQSFPASK